jgi:alpha-methylacyl-CoA racemase
MSTALAGVRVIDMAWLGPGTLVPRLLGDLGADVIRIEEARPGKGRRGGRSIAARPPDLLHMSSGFRKDLGLRNVRRLALDLKSEEGKEIFKRLVRTADVVIEGFRPGVVQRLGVDYESCVRHKQDIIYVSISGYGQDGPYAQRVGHDLNYIAIAGLLGMTGTREGPPVMPGFPAADHAAGAMSAVMHVLAALVQKCHEGVGQYADVSIMDAVVQLVSVFLEEYFATGVVPKRGATGITGLWPWYDVYQTRDSKWISVAAIEPWFYRNLCDALGRPELESRQWDQDAWESMRAEFKSIFRTRTRDEWVEFLSEREICFAPVLDVDEVVNNPQVQARGMVQYADHPEYGRVRVVASTFHLAKSPVSMEKWATLPGQHTTEILEELGYAEADVRNLLDKGVIGCAASEG